MQKESLGGCNVFVHLALSQIVQECGSQRRLSKVKEACQSLLDDIAAKKHEGREHVETVIAYIEPLKASCESQDPKLCGLALDCLQKLMAYKFIRNDLYYPSKKMPNGQHRTLSVLSSVVATICSCIKIPNEPHVQLQIIRCALTAVTDCGAHDNALQSLVSSVFNLMIHSKEAINQTTARTHLTQMINFIFNRLESESSAKTLDTGADALDLAVPKLETPVSPTAVETPASTSGDVSSSTGTSVTPSGRLSTGASTTPPPKGTQAPMTHSQKDAMVVFTFLCKVSSLQDVSEATLKDAPEMKKCVRSLEWIHKILQSSGPGFRQCAQLLHGIRDPLCHSLLKNCVSAVPGVFRISLSIVVTLICHFKRYLKNEIGLLLKNVFLWLLESTNTQYNQKTAVIQALQKVCSSSQVIIDIFVNYDCGMHSPNILERIVDSMSKMVQHEHLESNWISAREAAVLKELSLQTLVLILSSLVKWMNKFSAKGISEDDASSCEGYSDMSEVSTLGSLGGDGSSDVSFSGLSMSERLEKQRLQKIEIEKGVVLFNEKPAKGIKYLANCGLLEETPEAVGHFLRYTSGVDKGMVGDYLGGEGDFNKKALLVYVETLEFDGLSIDNALRKFLNVFTLPGEGQKIERILEQFSEAFVRHDTTELFDCPDAVYILAVAIVMLNTDLHNSQVRDKMSKTQFLSQLKGINDGKDLPQQFLEDIYDRIESKPFTNDQLGNIHSVAAAETLAVLGSTGSSLFLSKKERKQMHYRLESRSMLKQTKDLMENHGVISEGYYAANDITYVRPIFSVIWAPIHASFSTSLETAFEGGIIRLCLEGFEHGIHIASNFEMPTEREAFVSALSKMTYINNLRQISQKNIDSIRTLINIANQEGDYLQGSWLEVIRTISQLERLQVIGRAASAGRNQTNHLDGPAKPMDEQNALTIATQIDDGAINKIFANSVNLTQMGISNFMQCLCQVCNEEILHNPQPRLYCLQKVVEVATDNLGQRIIGIWSIISALFVEIGCRGRPQIAGMAIDSLRQMVMKCLDRQELLDCQLQPEFLDPFYRIMANAKGTEETRDLIMRCFEQIVLTKGAVLHAGWSSVFRALEVAAGDGNPEVVGLGWKLLHGIMKDFFEYVARDLVLSKATHALYSFSSSTCSLSMEAIEHFPVVAAQIAHTLEHAPNIINPQEAQTVWLSFMHDLSILSLDANDQTRQRAIEILGSVLDRHGSALSPQTWPDLFRTVLFEIIKQPVWPEANVHQAVAVSRERWVATTADSCFNVLAKTFIGYGRLPAVSDLLPEVLSFHVKMMKQTDTQLITVAMRSYRQIFEALSPAWGPEQWDIAAESLKVLLTACIIKDSHFLPYLTQGVSDGPMISASMQAAAQAKAASPATEHFRECLEDGPATFPTQQIVVQFYLSSMHRQQLVIEFLEEQFPDRFKQMSPTYLNAILVCLFALYTSACFFNSRALYNWRLALWQSGSSPEMSLLGSVVMQQTNAIGLYFKVAFWMKDNSPNKDAVLSSLLNRCSDVLQHFVAIDAPISDEAQLPEQLSETHGLAPVLVLIVSGLCSWDKELFKQHVCKLHAIFLELILSNDRGIRTQVKRYFELWSVYAGGITAG